MKNKVYRMLAVTLAATLVMTSLNMNVRATEETGGTNYETEQTVFETSEAEEQFVSADYGISDSTKDENEVVVFSRDDEEVFIETEEEQTVAADYGLSNPRTDAKGNVTWDCVYFGNYWQKDTNGDGTADTKDDKEPIKWRVLSVDGDDAFLLADYGLDCQPYNKEGTDVTWETCTLRSWLNGYDASSNTDGIDYFSNNFIEKAFSSSEQSAIIETTIENADNPIWGTEGGNNTSDKVFLLSLADVTNTKYGFSSDMEDEDPVRWSKASDYVEAQGAYIWSTTDEDDVKYKYNGNCWWWLRSPGSLSSRAAYVRNDGWAYGLGIDVCYDNGADRPALHLNLSSTTVWSKAGTVTSDGDDNATPAPSESPTPSATPAPTENPSDNDGKLSNPRKDANGIVTWDCVYFGSYIQRDVNKDGKFTEADKEPIKWRVLSVNGDEAFLLSEYNLDRVKYDNTTEQNIEKNVTWERSTIRSFLNGYGATENDFSIDYSNNNFIDNAFSEDEKKAINITYVRNDNNAEFSVEAGNDTKDKVFLLSLDEVTDHSYGFETDNWAMDNARIGKNTEYVNYIMPANHDAVNNWWWLRTPGCDPYRASDVNGAGMARNNGDYTLGYYTIRPALVLNLEATNLYKYAGTEQVTVVGYDGDVIHLVKKQAIYLNQYYDSELYPITAYKVTGTDANGSEIKTKYIKVKNAKFVQNQIGSFNIVPVTKNGNVYEEIAELKAMNIEVVAPVIKKVSATYSGEQIDLNEYFGIENGLFIENLPSDETVTFSLANEKYATVDSKTGIVTVKATGKVAVKVSIDTAKGVKPVIYKTTLTIKIPEFNVKTNADNALEIPINKSKLVVLKNAPNDVIWTTTNDDVSIEQNNNKVKIIAGPKCGTFTDIIAETPDGKEYLLRVVIPNVYVANKVSGKLHILNCDELPYEKNRVYYSSLEKANKAGYTDNHIECMGY